jgi:hypothetical protein
MKLKRIHEHVREYPVSIRISFLQCMLVYYAQLSQKQKQYPTVLTQQGWQAVFVIGDSFGFTLDGWIDALWDSL